MRKATTTAIATIFALAFISACQEEEPATGDDPEQQEPEEVELEVTDEVSDCGGFPELRPPMPHDGPIDGYCDAERLLWSYDPETTVLDMTDARVELNCCGEHSMDVEIIDGVYVFTETDRPDSAGRCDCMCIYDFALTASGVPNEVIDVRLERHVTDAGDAFLVWEGTIDLATGEGEIIVSDEATMWCDTL